MMGMNDEENAALVIRSGIEQAFLPLQKLVDQLLGPAATEIGLSLGDSLKVWRAKRRIHLFQKVQRFVNQSGADIKPVATRLFFPILEAASIEDDDEMQTRWAALLANEALATGSVHPSFIDILKQLAPEDARLLDKVFDWSEAHPGHPLQWWLIDRKQQQGETNEVPVSNLVRLGLIVSDYTLMEGEKKLKFVGTSPQVVSTPELGQRQKLSAVAINFVKACRGPRGAGE
jgi:hypothetical protein